MTTQHMIADGPNWSAELEFAAETLRSGGLVALPTETVYGLGANALDGAAVLRIFAAKGRPADNPLIVHIAEIQELDGLVTEVSDKARCLMAAFWPGPLTLVMRRTSNVPDAVTAGLDTVGVRMPAHPVALALIRAAGVPIAAPSANRSGKPSPTLALHVAEDMDGRIDIIVDGGACAVGLESTVVDVTVDPPMILRPGGVTREMMEQVVGLVEVDPALRTAGLGDLNPALCAADQRDVNLASNTDVHGDVNPAMSATDQAELNPDEDGPVDRMHSDDVALFGPDGNLALTNSSHSITTAPRSPGMKYRHYAPEAHMTVFCGSTEAMALAIAEAIEAAKSSGQRVGVLCSEEMKSALHAINRAEMPDILLIAGLARQPETYAAGIFQALRAFDSNGRIGNTVDVIFAEGMTDAGIGHAVMNRLGKASGGRVVHV